MMAFVAALQGFFFDAQPLVGDGAAAADLLHAVPAEFLDGPHRRRPTARCRRPRSCSVVEQTKGAGALRLRVATQDMSGDDVVKTDPPRRSATRAMRAQRLAAAGIVLAPGDAADHRLGAPGLGSRAPEAAARRQDRGRQRAERAPEPVPVRHSGNRRAAGSRSAAAAPARLRLPRRRSWRRCRATSSRRSRWWETALLLLICFTLFRRNFWMDRIVPPYRALPASEVVQRDRADQGSRCCCGCAWRPWT